MLISDNKWAGRFIDLAKTVSLWSKDGTKVGAVVVRPDKTIAAVGFNGLPPGMNDDDYFPLHEHHPDARTFKNACVIHAEENAILSCTDSSLKDFSIFIYGLHPCGHCASVIAKRGIKEVFSVGYAHPGWDFSMDVASKVFLDCGIIHLKVDVEGV